MKLCFLILFSVFTIELALASPKHCDDSISQLQQDTYEVHPKNLIRSTKQIASKDILVNYTPEIAESTLLKNLKFATSPVHQVDIIKVLAKVAGQNTLLALLHLLNNTNTKFVVKAVSINVLTDLKIPSERAPEVFYIFREILKKETLPPELNLKIMSILRKSENPQGLALFLEYQNSQDSSTRKYVIKDILDTHKPEVAESIFLDTLPNVQDSLFQVELIKALANIGKSKTQLALLELINSEDTDPLVEHESIKILKGLKISLEETFLNMARILGENPDVMSKKLALQFFEDREGE